MSSRGGIIEEVVRFLSLVLGLAVLASFSGCQHGARHTAASPTTTASATPGCSLHQLAVSYRGGGKGAGNAFGSVVIRNVSSTSCALAGKVAVTPLDRRGQLVAVASGEPLEVTVPSQGIDLTPNARAPIAGQNLPAGMVEASVVLSAEYRDDPGAPDGMCAAANEVQPAVWRVAFLGGTLTVENRDPDALTDEGAVASLSACRGSFGPPTLDPA
jgi:hypothetical protein